MNEVWKDIPEYKGMYQASNIGNIRSLKNKMVLKQNVSGRYYMVSLYKYGVRKTFSVHRLMSYAFFKYNINDKSIVVDHINNNPIDNRLCNLQIINNRQNASKDKWRKGKSSKHTGVCWDKSNKKWQADIRFNSKRYRLGRFDDELDASRSYQKALTDIEIGVFDPLNRDKYKVG